MKTIPIDVVAGMAYTLAGSDDPNENMDIRTGVMSIWEITNLGRNWVLGLYKIDEHLGSIDTFRSYLMFASEHPSRRKRTPMNVDKMVERWIPIIKGLSTAHDKATLDQCEYDSEEHLTPLLAAPVKQLREFYSKLTAALKADKSVPFFIWAMFEAWGDVMLKNAPDADVRQLKDALAEEIAGMVEKDVQPDLKTAIAGALRWRSPETLEKVKEAVVAGAKPKLKGRESCLFLEVGGVMVML